jgi:hypothetical protein
MLGPSWIALLRRIPPSQHDSLILMTLTGREVVMQRILRLDREYLVALARPAGTTDQPKLMVVPYDQLTYLSFSKKMADGEVEGLLGKPGEGVQLVEAGGEPAAAGGLPDAAAAEDTAVVEFAPDPAAEPAPDETPADAQPAKAVPPSKTVLLARLRQRLAGDVAKPAGS